ncbi:hypothetical protein CH275_07090 [Rhodococcus sp. 06-235-1A]|uniref:hypothetical protein n=1 Tax=Rhodococcus sp. 06-235-1A TaxID=2022508 RepID=UPI000B9A7078|nr:hypothetical protein [Rhodococcus sp. 06-235-1A]OZD06964.1 hypothetical protein CH275_07090 [Rhodococcus sp. 06-235-1A]
MNVTVIVLLGIVGVVLLVVGIVVLAKVMVNRLSSSSQSAIEEQFVDSSIVKSDPMANFFGLGSKGGAQVRGNGALVLTDSELWFRRIGSATALRIPLQDISGVDVTRSHAGKTVGRSLLRVQFRMATVTDSVAWLVENPESWVHAINGDKTP